MLWSQFSAIFPNFRRKNWRFSQKPMLWSQFLQKLAVVWAKNANFFAKFFGENILKIITSVPAGTPILQIFSPKNLAKNLANKLAFVDQSTVSFGKIWILLSVFNKNADFCWKLRS
jgi:hypothetical protein